MYVLLDWPLYIVAVILAVIPVLVTFTAIQMFIDVSTALYPSSSARNNIDVRIAWLAVVHCRCYLSCNSSSSHIHCNPKHSDVSAKFVQLGLVCFLNSDLLAPLSFCPFANREVPLSLTVTSFNPLASTYIYLQYSAALRLSSSGTMTFWLELELQLRQQWQYRPFSTVTLCGIVGDESVIKSSSWCISSINTAFLLFFILKLPLY